jgi:hypothetical protein
MKSTPKALTHLLPLMSTSGLPIYVARIPAAPFASRLDPSQNASNLIATTRCRGLSFSR